MKGIVLAGGKGTRLGSLTQAVSKQLLPIYDKPMVHYPLSVLMLAGISEVLVISSPTDLPSFERLLGSGADIGIRLSYAEQSEPRGLADAFLVGRSFIGDDDVCLILGDNVFYGAGLMALLREARARLDGAELFGCRVKNPERYGVAELDGDGKLVAIEEKPSHPKSPFAVTGLYMYDNAVVDIAAGLSPSARGELEITDVNNAYIAQDRAHMSLFGRGYAWLDTGTPDALLDAGQFVAALRRRQGMHVACLEEVAFQAGFIDATQLVELAGRCAPGEYRDYLLAVARERR